MRSLLCCLSVLMLTACSTTRTNDNKNFVRPAGCVVADRCG